MTRYAIGDIHGGAKTFRALLDRIRPKRGDRVHLLGDYMDRGPDSKGVLDMIMQLMDEGYDVRPVRGNHEDMLLQSLTGSNGDFSRYWVAAWGQVTLRSFAVTSPDDIPARYLAFLHRLPYTWSDDNFVFVHAGLDMAVNDPLTESSPLTMVWGGSNSFDTEKLRGRILVTGHEVHPLPLIKASLLTSHFKLDNGAFTNMQPHLGNLVGLNLETRELIIQPWCDDYEPA